MDVQCSANCADDLSVLWSSMVEGKIPAGFPSPGDDFATKRHDLNELLITHPLATFFWQVSGGSMREAGIFDSDILVVNRALQPAHRSTVVAQVDGEFSVKFLHKRADRVKLVPANPTFPESSSRKVSSSSTAASSPPASRGSRSERSEHRSISTAAQGRGRDRMTMAVSYQTADRALLLATSVKSA